ncbi:MAG: PASTA domain-containing protein [Burkholderiaceae bacterium]|nr:PASTA domain-containing protein [Burkholderiaceae bacterium]
MRAKRFLTNLGIAVFAAGMTASVAQQPRPCSSVAPTERAAARAAGACRDIAPIIDTAPQNGDAASASLPVSSVVGLAFDDAKDRLTRFQLRRSYRPSAEPAGTVLEQQPAPPARLPAGAIVRVVLSDGTLRPPPKVAASEIDEPRPARAAPPVQQPQPAVANVPPVAAVVEPPPPARTSRESSVRSDPSLADPDRLAVPNVLGMSEKSARTRLGRYRVELRERPSSAPAGHVIDQDPKAPARATPGQSIRLIVSSGPANNRAAAIAQKALSPPVSETLELANVTDRSFEEANSALAEFRVRRVEVAGAAPNGQVIGQSPAAGSMVQPGSAIALQVSDGSLAAPVTTGANTPAAMTSAAATAAANGSVATPPAATPPAGTTEAPTPAAVTPAAVTPAAATPPAAAPETSPAASAPATPAATTPEAAPPVSTTEPSMSEVQQPAEPSLTALMPVLGVGALLGLALAAFWLARRNRSSGEVIDIEPTINLPPEPDVAIAPDPEIKFAARLEVGDAQIEFIATSDTADADLDEELDPEEATIEHWGDRHG